MRTRLFDRDPATGTTRYFHYDDDNDTFVIQTALDVEDRIASNRAAFNDDDTGFRGDMHRVASIPLHIYWELKEKGIVDDPKAFAKWLNDPDNRGFRTKAGRV